MECEIVHGNKRHVYECKDPEDANEVTEWKKFITFCSSKLNLTDVKVFLTEMDKTGKNDSGPPGTQLIKKEEMTDGDELLNEMCDAMRVDTKRIYFIIEGKEIEMAKYSIKVDFSRMMEDEKEETFLITKNDINDETAWFDSYQDLTNEIGHKLGNENWEANYCLFSSHDDKQINKIEEFINVFQQSTDNNNSICFYIDSKKMTADSGKLKMFLISNNKGECASWKPDNSEVIDENDETQWKKEFLSMFKSIIRDQFGLGRKDKVEIKYNPYNDENSINIGNKIDSNILKWNNIGKYWNLLLNDEKANVMNFMIGDIIGKKINIICVESLQNGRNGMLLLNDDNDETNESKFLSFLKKVTNSENEDFNSKWPLKLYFIKDTETVSKILSECYNNLSDFRQIVSLYDLKNSGIDSLETWKNWFSENSDNGNNNQEWTFFVENKACIMAFYGNNVFFWKPETIDSIKWENEFVKMKNDICKWFDIVNDKSLKLTATTNDEFENTEIVNANQMQQMWESGWDQDDYSYIQLVVDGYPCAKFVIITENVVGSRDKICFSIGVSLSDSIIYNAFNQEFGKQIGNLKWQTKFKLIDACYKPNESNNVSNEKSFVKLCKSCKRKKINEIILRLDTKFVIKVRLMYEKGEQMKEFDGNISFEHLWNDMYDNNNDTSINIGEYYRLYESETNVDIVNDDSFDKLVSAARDRGKTGVSLIFEPKFCFYISYDTVESNNSNISNEIRIPYFVEAINNFESFCGKLNEKMKIANWQTKCNLIDTTFGANNNIVDDSTFNGLILQCKCKHKRNIFLRLQQKRVFCIDIDISGMMEDEDKQNVEMKIYENELLNQDNYDIMCNTINQVLGKSNETWKNDSVIMDRASGQISITSNESLITLLENHASLLQEIESKIELRLESLIPQKEKQGYDADTIKQELTRYQSKWENEKELSFNINNCDAELEFIHSNLRCIKVCVKVLTQECKIDINEIEMTQAQRESMKQRFDHVLSSMEREGHYHGSDVSKDIYEAKQNALDMRWNEAFRKVDGVLTELRPFNIKRMLSLYDKTSEAAKQVENKDICLLIGHTGVGKSTTIHFLAGSTMEYDESNGHIYPRTIFNGALKKVKTDFKIAESVTRFISSVPISLNEAGISAVRCGGKDLIELCDTPGFNDTGGAEMDVSNGLGIVKAVSGAARVKVIIVIGESDIDQRMNGLTDLAHTIGKLIPDYDDYLQNKAILPIFTKIPRSYKESTVKTRLNQGYTDLQNVATQDDSTLISIIDNIVNSESGLVIVRPLTMKRQDLLEKIFDRKSEWIETPKTAFKTFVTDASLRVINEQILKDKAKIMQACDDSNCGEINFSIINNKLYDMVRLTDVLPDSKKIANALADCVDKILQAWNNRCQSVMKPLANVSDRGLKDFENDISKYSIILNESKQIEKVRQSYSQHIKEHKEFEDATFTSEAALCESLTNAFDFLLSKLTIESESLSFWKKADIMANQFSEMYKKQFMVKVRELVEQLEQMKAAMLECIINDNFTEVNEYLTQFDGCCQLNEYFEKHGFDIVALFNHLVNDSILGKLEDHQKRIIKTFGAGNNSLGTSVAKKKCRC